MSHEEFMKRNREDGRGLFVTPVPTSSSAASRTHLSRTERSRRASAQSEDAKGIMDRDDPEQSIENELGNDARDGDIVSVSDEPSDGEDDEEDSTYSQLQEELPSHAAYNPKLPHLVQRAEKAACTLYEKLCNAGGDIADVKNMADKARQVTECPRAKKPLIMLLGDTGTGKSSTTNSFVDDSNATKAAAVGTSCTCVPTFIESELPEQHTSCAAEIVFFDSETQKNFLQEQLDNYNRFHFQADPTWPDEQARDYRALADTAAKIFRALFCDQDEFISPGRMARTLDEAYDEPFSGIIDSMVEWCGRMLADCELKDGHPFCSFQAHSTEELNELLNPHIFETATFEEPALWPLIQHVTKGLKDSRILDYVRILDLPGTSDSDRVRGAIAHKFIQDCDALWVVTRLSRAISDCHVDRNLATYGERFGDNVAVIATHSDSGIDEQLKNEMIRVQQSIGDWKSHQQQIKQLQKGVTLIEARLKPRGKKRQKTMTEAEENNLRREKDNMEEELRQVQNTQFEELADGRNAYITRGIVEAYQKHMAPDSKLQVYCISNTHYESLKGRPSGDSRQLSASGTGIPNLRSYALNLAAPDSLRTRKTYINNVGVLTKGAAMWVGANPLDRDESLLKVIGEPLQLWDAAVDIYIQRTKDVVKNALTIPLENGRASFIAAALEILKELVCWNSSSFRAFVAKSGKHQTAAQPYQAWNERFTEKQNETAVRIGWAKIIAHQQALADAVGMVLKQLDEIPDELSKHPGSVPLEVRQFEQLLRGYIVSIMATTETREEEFAKAMRNIKLDVSHDVPSGYFTKAMLPVYTESKSIRGEGCTAAMQGNIQTWLRGNGSIDPFKAVTTGSKHDLNQAANLVARNLQSDVKNILKQMHEQFVLILQKKEQTSAETKARKKLNLPLGRTDRELDNVLADLLEIEGEGDVDDD